MSDEQTTPGRDASQEEAAQARYRDLTETPVKRLIPRLAVPMVVSELRKMKGCPL